MNKLTCSNIGYTSAESKIAELNECTLYRVGDGSSYRESTVLTTTHIYSVNKVCKKKGYCKSSIMITFAHVENNFTQINYSDSKCLVYKKHA